MLSVPTCDLFSLFGCFILIYISLIHTFFLNDINVLIYYIAIVFLLLLEVVLFLAMF